MSTGWLDNAFLLILGVAVFWFVLRFRFGPRRGGPSFSSFFRREPAETVQGLGQKAIATLLQDTRALVDADNALRGLLLAGPFAVRDGRSDRPVTLIALTDVPENYREADWLLRWAYPARGHKVSAQESEAGPGYAGHHLTLRGAPPVNVFFVACDSPAPPDALKAALAQGVATLNDPAGQAERLRRRWDSLSRAPRTAPDGHDTEPNNKEETP